MVKQSTEEQPIIELSNVTFRYPGAQSDSLTQVTITIERGDFIAIVGSNGSGKSTLCKCFNGLIPNYYFGDIEGTVKINGRYTTEQSVSELSKHVAYVFQDFENQLVRPTVYDEVCFAPLNFGYENYRERGLKALQMLEIEHLKSEWIWQLSGGQKHMTALAAALALEPEVIVVDEPVAQLDPAHARVIYEKLKILNERFGKTIVVIEHHTEFIADYCRNMILMESGGRVRWKKSVAEGLSAVSELSAMNIQPPQVTQAFHVIHPLDDRHHLKEYPVTISQAVDYWEPMVNGHHQSYDMSDRKASAPANEPIVRIQRVSSGYTGIDHKKKPILRELDLNIHEGDRIALVGNNGAGKSTLLRLISGIRRPWEGTVTVCGKNTREASPEQLADHVAFLFQNPEEMFIADNIRQDIAYFLNARKKEGVEPFIDEVLQRFKLIDLQTRDGRLLSGGQQRRATLAIGMAMTPTIMLLDEPTASLDIASRREMTMLFDQLHDRVKAVIVATHDMQLVADWANRVIVLHEGRILLDTDSQTLFQQKAVLERASLIAPQIVQLSNQLGISPACLSVDQFVTRMNHILSRQEVHHGIG